MPICKDANVVTIEGGLRHTLALLPDAEVVEMTRFWVKVFRPLLLKILTHLLRALMKN